MSCSDHEDHEYHVVTMRFSRWGKEISSWWMPNLTCSPPQEVPRGLTVTFLLPWGISRSHHEILLVTTRNLLVNQNLYLPPPKASSWSRREILLVTTRNLLVNVSQRSWEVADDEVSSLFFHRLRICCWLEGQLSDRSCFEQWKMCGNTMVFFLYLYKDLRFSDSFWMVDAMLAAWPQYLLHLQEVVLPLQLLDTVHLKVHHQPLHDHLIELWIF